VEEHYAARAEPDGCVASDCLASALRLSFLDTLF
jgi:hypothetical protein